MRLLNSNLEFCDYDESPPPYAILSHTWSEKNEEEVTYQDLRNGTTKSLLKLELCRDWAKAASFEYFWIDTCCIDKRNDAEISYAIRSMWRWYLEAGVCFVYLSDLSKKRKLDTDWRDALKDCRWFTRGWTLQELVASKRVEFYARDGYLGTKEDLLPALKSITGIDLGAPLPGHATRLSWVTKRVTKRPEDRAYCILGICDVSLDPRYGEGGESAWRRLQDAIIHRHGTIALEIRGTATDKDHRETILEALRFDALETRRSTVTVALAKTCKWILSHPACAKWLKREHKFFWIKGKPGAGKSVLISYLDHYVSKRLVKSSTIRLYFYFNARGGQLEKSFLGLYRSLLVQLIDAVPELAHELDVLSTPFNVPQLQSVLISTILGLGRQIWLFIDALDECREGDVRELIELLDGLQEAELYVCFASRHYPIVKVPTNLSLTLEEVDEHKQDLSTYVEQLDLEGEELAQMQLDIVEKANGIFLWVVLVVKILEDNVENARFHAMQSTLRELPSDLPELFETIILRDDKHKGEFLLCLRWILYARRPLTLKEWYFAMMAGVDGPLERTKGVTDHRMETFLLSSSKGLAELTKGKSITAQFIHESVRDFLVSDGGFQRICGRHESLESIAQEQIKKCCLRGMEFDLPKQLKQHKNNKKLLTEEEHDFLRTRYPFAEYATTYLLYHADQAAVGFCQQHFLEKEFVLSDWLDRFNALQKSKPQIFSDLPSLTYLCAERNLANLLSEPTEALTRDMKQRYQTPLIAAIVNSSWEVLRVFLTEMGLHNVDDAMREIECKAKFVLWPRSLLGVPWLWTLRNGLLHLSKHLFASIHEDQARKHIAGTCALHIASAEGLDDMVRMLLDAGANVNALDAAGDKALKAASAGGYDRVVRMLLDAGADVHTQDGKGTALQAASANGHDRIARMLLDAGADFNVQNIVHQTVLQTAAANGQAKVVRVLLDAGADIDAQGDLHRTALHIASSAGRDAVVGILIDAGANLEARDPQNTTVLHIAAANGRENAVRMLIDAGADVNAGQGTALQAAIANDHDGVVQILLNAGVEVDSQKIRDIANRSGLQTASAQGCEVIATLLLDHGADIDAIDDDHGSALQAACSRQKKSMVKLLLERGADVNARGGYFGFALQAASVGRTTVGIGPSRLTEYQMQRMQLELKERRGSLSAQPGQRPGNHWLHITKAESQIVRMLLDKGAEINMQGGNFGNALQAACAYGHIDIAELLLDRGAYVNAHGGCFGSAIQAASFGNYGNIVELLLDRGARTETQGGQTSDMPQAASLEWQEDIAEALPSRVR